MNNANSIVHNVKLRFLAAALIFAAYIFCDRAGVKIYRYSTGEVAEKIAKGYDYSEAREEVMQVFRAFVPARQMTGGLFLYTLFGRLRLPYAYYRSFSFSITLYNV